MYLRINNEDNTTTTTSAYAFVDFCKSVLETNKKNEIDINYWSEESPVTTELNCSRQINDLYLESELAWQSVEPSFNNFRCAKITSLIYNPNLLRYAVNIKKKQANIAFNLLYDLFYLYT